MNPSIEENCQTIKDCTTDKRIGRISAWDIDFLGSIEERLEAGRNLSEKQQSKLDEIFEKATAKG